ncbi:MAG: AbrB/MazE/SpoVT family DNA-binding domain-containing protein [Defluviitaleaceae bacterium]|nr:AbrB/MazE/SpoVT family DNA-binding domain-containing protein [Defluviitaleaceae bacterium]
MYFRAAEVKQNGQISLPDEVINNLGLLAGDFVALIPDNGRIIMRKLSPAESMMTFEEFLLYRDVKIRDATHERVARMLYGYLGSVTGNNRLLPDLMGHLLGIDASLLTVPACSYSNIFETTPPYDKTDYFVKLSNDIQVYIYGNIMSEPLRALIDNEYVVFALSHDFSGSIKRNANRHIYLY